MMSYPESAAIAFDIPGDIAYECVRSMPFKSDLGVAFVDEYAKYIQWQSTVENLKSALRPPLRRRVVY